MTNDTKYLRGIEGITLDLIYGITHQICLFNGFNCDVSSMHVQIDDFSNLFFCNQDVKRNHEGLNGQK